MRVVTIIPARGGSKTIPRKNMINFCGKPLLVWSVEQAGGSDKANEVYVSTDDEEIASVARDAGAVAIKRPPEISDDWSSSEESLIHALGVIPHSGEIDLIVFLQATSPVREKEDIDRAVDQLYGQGADSLFSGSAIGDFYIWRQEGGSYESINYDFRNRQMKQAFERQYVENGSIYIFKVGVLTEFNNRLGGKITLYEMPFWKSFQIDDWAGYEICKFYMKNRIIDKDGHREQA